MSEDLSKTLWKLQSKLEKQLDKIYKQHDENIKQDTIRASLCHNSPLEEDSIKYQNCPCRDKYQRINAQIEILMELNGGS